MSDDMTYEEYLRHVHPEAYTLGDYGKWIKFGDSYPPINPKGGTTVEVLYENGNPGYEWINMHDDGTVRWRDFDFNQEFSWGEYEEHYWRFIPEDPPGNFGYNVG